MAGKMRICRRRRIQRSHNRRSSRAGGEERQQCLFSTAGYVGPRSPDHADAVIWGLTELMLGPPVGENLFEYYGGILAESRV